MDGGRKAVEARMGRSGCGWDNSWPDDSIMEMAAPTQAAISSGRIVPTEARPSELSGCIVGASDGGVKAKSAAK